MVTMNRETRMRVIIRDMYNRGEIINDMKKEFIGTWEVLEDGIIPNDVAKELLYMKLLFKLQKTHYDITDIKVVIKQPHEISGPIEKYATYGIKGYGYRKKKADLVLNIGYSKLR